MRYFLAAMIAGLISLSSANADIKARGTGAILSSNSSGKIVGQDADLNALIAKALGVPVEVGA